MQSDKEPDHQRFRSGAASTNAVEGRVRGPSREKNKILSQNKNLSPDVNDDSTSAMPLKEPRPERRRADRDGCTGISSGEARRHRSFQSSLRNLDAHDHGRLEEPRQSCSRGRATSHFVAERGGEVLHGRSSRHEHNHAGDRHERREGRRSVLNSEAERRRREQRAKEERERRFSKSDVHLGGSAGRRDSGRGRPRGLSLSQSESKGLDYNPTREHRRRSADGKRDIHDKVHDILDQITRVKADFESSSRSCNHKNDSIKMCLASLESIYKDYNRGVPEEESAVQKRQSHGPTVADADSSSWSTPPTATSFTDSNVSHATSSNLSTATVVEEVEETFPADRVKKENGDGDNERGRNFHSDENGHSEEIDELLDNNDVGDYDDESLGSLLHVTGQDQVIEIKDFDPSLVVDSTSPSNATKSSEDSQQGGVPRVILSTNSNDSVRKEEKMGSPKEEKKGEPKEEKMGSLEEPKQETMNSTHTNSTSNLNHPPPKYKPPPKHPAMPSKSNLDAGAVTEGGPCQVTEQNKNLNLNFNLNSVSRLKPPPPKRVPPPPQSGSLPTKSTESFTSEAGSAGSAGSSSSVNATAESVSTEASVKHKPPPPRPRFAPPPLPPAASLPPKTNETIVLESSTHDQCHHTTVEENNTTNSATQSPIGINGIGEFSTFLKKTEQDCLQQQQIHNPPTTPKSPAKPRVSLSFTGMPLPPPKTATTPVTPKKNFEFQPPVRRSQSHPTDNSSVASGGSSVFGGNIPPPPPLTRRKSLQQKNSVPPPPPPPLPRRPLDQQEESAANSQNITPNSNQPALKSILRKSLHVPPPSLTNNTPSVTLADLDKETQPTSTDATTPTNSESGPAASDSSQPIQPETSFHEELKDTKSHHVSKYGLKSVLKKFLHSKRNDSIGADNKNNAKNTHDKNVPTQKMTDLNADTISISSSSSSAAMPSAAACKAKPKPASTFTPHSSPPIPLKPTIETEQKAKLLNPNNRRPKHVFDMPFTDQFGEFGFYTGEVDEDVRPHGQGKMKYENGVFYEGKWKNGNQDSSAVLQRERILSGFTSWRGVQKKDGTKDGICHVYGMAWIDNSGMSGKYFGKVNDKNLPHGMGKMVYDMGLIAEGEWVEGNLVGAASNGSMMGAAATVVPGGSVIGGGMSVLGAGGMSVVGGGGMSVMGSEGMSIFQGMPVFSGSAMGPMPYQHQSQGKPFKPMMNPLPEEVPCSIPVANDTVMEDTEQPQQQQHQDLHKPHMEPPEQQQQHRPQSQEMRHQYPKPQQQPHEHRQQHPKPQQQLQEQRQQHHKQQRKSRSHSPKNIDQPQTEKVPSISIVGGPLFEEMKMKEQEETFKKNAPSESVTGSIIFC